MHLLARKPHERRLFQEAEEWIDSQDSQWEPTDPDENTAYYKAKLKELYNKFQPFIEEAASSHL